ncbi:motility associated factor glycosyltransferase family protein [Bacillota bacterium Lsc_1132]
MRNIDNLEIDFQLENTKTGMKTVKMSGYYLHSKYNPIREAENFAGCFYKPNHLHILFGFGLGYITNELIKILTENEFLIVVEPNYKLVETSIHLNLYNDLDREPRHSVLTGDIKEIDETIIQFIDSYKGKVQYNIAPNYNKIYPEYGNKLGTFIRERMLFTLMNINTIHQFSDLWQTNLINNLYHGFRSKPLSSLANSLTCPAIIVSGGPSLTKQLDLLKSVGNRALILCAGSTINTLLKNNIKPHLIVTIDGGIENYTVHFKDLNINDIPLIFSLNVHKDIPNEYNSKSIAFAEDIINKEWLCDLLEKDIGFLHGGPSVANFAFEIAMFMTSGPICFIGQDLAYTNNKTHAEGNNHFKLLEEDGKENQLLVETDGYYDISVKTSVAFLAMKRAFESLISSSKKMGDNRKIINSTEGGVHIIGTERVKFEDFINELDKDFSIEIESITNFSFSDGQNWLAFERKINRLCEEAQNTLELSEKALHLIKSLKNSQKNKLIKLLEDIDSRLQKLLENQLMFFTLQPVLIRMNHRYLPNKNETDKEKYERVMEKSVDFYKGIGEAATKTETWLRDLLKKIQADQAGKK